jgi:chromosome segregation ATPase
MPVKQTRESIESELPKNETDRVIRKLRGAAQDWEEPEEHLQEAQVGLPRFYRSVERLAAVLDELKKDLEEQVQAETSALKQLMTILDGRRGH